jgi:pre-mRNA-processing factor 40
VPASDEPEFANPEEAEAAFVKVLKRSGVQPDWSWEQALRAIVKDPQYRAIKDPRERKAAFEKYCHDVIVQDKEKAKERMAKLRADFGTMLRSHPEIKHYTRWKTARPMIEGETIFRSTNNDDERRQLFNDYVQDLKKAHREQQTSLRKSAMDGLIDLLPKLSLEPYTRWSEAQGIIQNTAPFQNEEKYQTLSKYDILTVFQNHVKALERTFNDSRQQEKNKKHRKERQARDGFKALLSGLRREGKIRAGSKWSQVYPMIDNDDRYKAMLGQPGSTPMDLFWDVVEEDERALRGTRNDVLDVIDDKRFEVTLKTTFPEFEVVVRSDRRTANIEGYILELIFERLQEKKSSKRMDDDRQAERHQRRAIDDFRSYLKRVEPPITVTDSYEDIKPRLAKSPEFMAVATEEARQSAFEKHIRRLKEKEEEAERDRLRRRDRGDSYRDSRGERSHRGSARPARSRSPEPDPYEADRRKAIAERERNYRKSSMAESLLSDRRSNDGHHDPVRDRERDRDRERERDRDRRDRDRDSHRDRDHRDHRDRDRERYHDEDRPRSRRGDELNHYDRERRTREEDRERLYRRRVDRDVNELPYGDERPSSSRRRRPEDDDADRRDSRDTKRLKRESSRERTLERDVATKSKTPQPAQPQKAESPSRSVRAGSEEGEIEED